MFADGVVGRSILTENDGKHPFQHRKTKSGNRLNWNWPSWHDWCHLSSMSLVAFWLGNVLRATTACNFSSLIWPAGSAPAALASLLFDHPEPQISGKNAVNRDFPTFSHTCIFFLLTLSLIFSLLGFSSLTLPPSAFPSVHIVGSFTSKLPSITNESPGKMVKHSWTKELNPWKFGVNMLFHIETTNHFWKFRPKNARRCGAKHMSSSKCTKHTILGLLLEVQMSKKCTPLWREANFQLKMYKTHQHRTIFDASYVVFRGRRKGLCTLSKVRKKWRSCSSFNYNYNYKTLHYTTLQNTQLHYTTLH